MSERNEKYRSLLSDEIVSLSHILSQFLLNRDQQPKISSLSPEATLGLLKKHRLYSLVYNLKMFSSAERPERWISFHESLKDLAHANNFHMLQKTGLLVKISQTFEKSGIPFISLKGPLLSQILYDDLALKASIDLDILISRNDWNKTVTTLKEMGFVQSKYQPDLNTSQKKYVLKHFHHLGFYHSVEKINVELHWQLSPNRYLLNWEFNDLYRRSVKVNIGNQPVHTLEPVSMIIYMMVHGAHHAWARLDWLYEFAWALKKYQDFYSQIREGCNQQGLVHLFHFSTRICNIVFNTGFAEISGKNEDSMIRYCITSINTGVVADHTKPMQRMKHKIYISAFKSDIRYRAQVWLALQTNMLDWNTIRLPSRLFFLYYLLRPFLVIFNLRKTR